MNAETKNGDVASVHASSDMIDARGPRFAASITAVLLLVTVFLSLTTGRSLDGSALRDISVFARALEPAALLLLLLFVLFLWGAMAGVKKHPFGLIFQKFVRPRLSSTAELEPAAPPTFAQGVGALVAGIGLVLHLFGVPYALPIAAAAAFIAAFLNAAFGYCLGCEIYLLLRRAKLVRA